MGTLRDNMGTQGRGTQFGDNLGTLRHRDTAWGRYGATMWGHSMGTQRDKMGTLGGDTIWGGNTIWGQSGETEAGGHSVGTLREGDTIWGH